MGMFDDIDYTMPCPFCGRPLAGFQSKSGPCLLHTLTPAELWRQREERVSIDFYTSCDDCAAVIDVAISPGVRPRTADQWRRHMAGEKLPPLVHGPILPGDE